MFEDFQYHSLYKKQDCKEFNYQYHKQENILQNKNLEKSLVLSFMETWKRLQLEHRCNYCFEFCRVVIVT